jgi:hypothetical protein
MSLLTAICGRFSIVALRPQLNNLLSLQVQEESPALGFSRTSKRDAADLAEPEAAATLKDSLIFAIRSRRYWRKPF